MDALARWNVHQSGPDEGPVLIFAHGFGCDQHMWRHVAPAFADEFRVVCFDFVGAGGSDLTAYDPERYSTLQGYADDVLLLCAELGLEQVTYVGHSVAAMIGVLAEVARPDLFDRLVLVGPSPRYVDTDDYRGGFSADDIEQLLESLDSNYLGWSSAMAPVIMGNPDHHELGDELTASFCGTDPDIARRFARVTFTSDNRQELGRVSTPTLVLQCRDDVIAPLEVGTYVRDSIPGSTMTVLDATGHCPNLSAPDETVAAMADFVRAR
jgi:sigma-B regulation protein RsbQ